MKNHLRLLNYTCVVFYYKFDRVAILKQQVCAQNTKLPTHAQYTRNNEYFYCGLLFEKLEQMLFQTTMKVMKVTKNVFGELILSMFIKNK